MDAHERVKQIRSSLSLNDVLMLSRAKQICDRLHGLMMLSVEGTEENRRGLTPTERMEYDQLEKELESLWQQAHGLDV